MEKWRDKVAIIAGSVSNISTEILKDLVNSEVTVVLLGREAHKTMLTHQRGRARVFACECDVSSIESIKQAFKWIEQTLGTVHILINCPGCNKHPKDSADENANELASVANMNLVMGLHQCTKEAIISMRNHNVDGCIINVNSLFDHKVPINLEVSPDKRNYGLTSIQQDITALKTGRIRITNLNPGLVRAEIVGTEMYPVNMSYNRFPTLSVSDISQAVQYVLSAPANVEISELKIKPAGL